MSLSGTNPLFFLDALDLPTVATVSSLHLYRDTGPMYTQSDIRTRLEINDERGRSRQVLSPGFGVYGGSVHRCAALLLHACSRISGEQGKSSEGRELGGATPRFIEVL